MQSEVSLFVWNAVVAVNYSKKDVDELEDNEDDDELEDEKDDNELEGEEDDDKLDENIIETWKY